MRRLVVLAALATSACLPGEPPAETAFNAEVRAIDGDTVAADFRLLGIDAFERRQLCAGASLCWPCGAAAQDLAAKRLRDQSARITIERAPSYGRPVATVSVGGKDLGEELIRAGLALPQPKYLAGDPERSRRYALAHAEARARKAGALAGQWIAPEVWRRGERLACER